MNVCIFCGGKNGAQTIYQEAAFALGESLAQSKHTIIFGGARHGLMGAVAQGATLHQGEIIGVVPANLASREFASETLTKRIDTIDLPSRKKIMMEMADVFVVLPGGFGTFDEMFEALCLSQVGVFQKRVLVLNVAHFYDALIQFISHAKQQQFVHENTNELIQFYSSVPALIQALHVSS